ncbi:MAG: hypothetical protein JSW28_06800, partial [Thermoplasmata archaeon]
DKYKQYRHLITASNYITPFNVVSIRDVKGNLHSTGEVKIFSKTPSIGGSWSTHPSLKYSSEQNDILGEKSVFSKVSSENNILVEKENLMKMEQHISVPKVLEVYRNREEDLSELHEMKPGCQIGAVLVEEFIDSVSLGQGVVEERIDLETMEKGVLGILRDMHKFCAHRDLKHSHIRINLDPRTCESLTLGIGKPVNLEIRGFSVIDVETTQMREDFSNEAFGASVRRDISQLLTSITGYMSTLELDTDVMRKFFPTPLDKRLRRFGMLLDALREEYEIDLSDCFLTKSRTTAFLINKLGS